MPSKTISVAPKIGVTTDFSKQYGDIHKGNFLFICGELTSSRIWTTRFYEIFNTKRYSTLRYDHRNTALSSKCEKTYSLLDLANDAIEVLKAYQIEKTFVVSHGMMGSYIAQELALNFPQHIEGMCLINGSPLGDGHNDPITPQALEYRAFKKDSPQLEDNVNRYMSIMQNSEGQEAFYPNNAQRVAIDLVTRTMQPEVLCSYHMDLTTNAKNASSQKKGVLQKITIPTLIIQGNLNTVNAHDDSLILHHKINKSELIEMPSMGYFFLRPDVEGQIPQSVVSFRESR